MANATMNRIACLTWLFLPVAGCGSDSASTDKRAQSQDVNAMTTLEVIGVYPIEAPEPVHLVELRCKGVAGVFDVGTITQELPGQPRSNW
jgi:hypothetical protein